MKQHSLLARLALLLAAALCGDVFSAPALQGFVTRRGDQLFEGDKPFRFISVNIPNLQIVEDNFAPGAPTAWGWPNEFELADALESVRQMGGQVARSYVLSVRREGSDIGDHVYVRGPGEFNEEAFKTLDLLLEVAGRKGVRLIIPLVDNWKWHGGRGEYAAFRGKQPDDFWTDEQIINDFEQTVRYVLTRVNSRTGVAYRDDPAILGWETGNELDSPPQWTARIARLMKEIDPNHLVIDGRSLHGVPPESLDDPHIDVVTTHHYPNADQDSFLPAIVAAREAARGKKPYFVGEFGFVPADEVERIYDAVIDGGASGALIWSLRYHHRDGGFYWHSEPLGGGLYKAYHWPGFSTGDAYEESAVMQLTRNRAFRIRGLEPPPLDAPAAPTLLAIADPGAISWQGSAGARSYALERAEHNQGPWTVVAAEFDDSTVQYRPLFNDDSVEPGRAYFYRVRAENAGGGSPPSNVVGPVVARHRTMVDEGRDLAKLASASPGVKPTGGGDRQRGEDAHRLLVPRGESITYETPGPLVAWQATLYLENAGSAPEFAYSADGKRFELASPRTSSRGEQQGDYGYLRALRARSATIPAGARYLRITAAGAVVELSRIELCY